MNPIVSYIIFGVLMAILIGGGILVRTKRFSGGKQRKFRKAILIKTDREFGEVVDKQGVTHKGVTAMTLTFQFKDGTTKSFPVTTKMRGRCGENEWGDLMYEGDNLLKFECPSGTIGTKLFVPDKNSVFNKFSNK